MPLKLFPQYIVQKKPRFLKHQFPHQPGIPRDIFPFSRYRQQSIGLDNSKILLYYFLSICIQLYMSKSKADSLGDRMKRHENVYRFLLPKRTYTILRVGRAFHTWTKGLAKPTTSNLWTAWMPQQGHFVSNQRAQFAYIQSMKSVYWLWIFSISNWALVWWCDTEMGERGLPSLQRHLTFKSATTRSWRSATPSEKAGCNVCPWYIFAWR